MICYRPLSKSLKKYPNKTSEPKCLLVVFVCFVPPYQKLSKPRFNTSPAEASASRISRGSNAGRPLRPGLRPQSRRGPAEETRAGPGRGPPCAKCPLFWYWYPIKGIL